ncbi:MAG: RNA methyltransferase [Ktedonobacteraceae bacterium]
MTLITSPTNPRVSRLKDLHTTRGRKKNGLFLMEGPHLLDALLDAQVIPREVYYQPEYLQRTPKGRALLDRLLHTTGLANEQRVEVSERVIEAISDTVTSQGVVSVLPLDAFLSNRVRALRTQRVAAITATIQHPVLLILDNIADPGNMGTILRTALAADVDTVLLTPNCVDCYSPKVVRAAAGTHILLPIESDISWSAIAEKIQAHCHGTPRVLLAEAGGSSLYYEQDLTQPFALIIGNEAHGPSSEAHTLATTSITIPLANTVESLNAAMAAGIVLYEAVRQREVQKQLMHKLEQM